MSRKRLKLRRKQPERNGLWVELRLARDGTPILLFAEDATRAERELGGRWIDAWVKRHPEVRR